MELTEAEEFLRNVAFVAFPGPREWLYERSPDKQATFRIWASVLTKIELSDAKRVIDGWLDGSIPMFTWTDREAWATVIVRAAKELNRDRDLRAESERVLEAIGTRSSDEPYEPMLPQLQSMLGTTSSVPAIYQEVKAPKESSPVSQEQNRRSILNYLSQLQKEEGVMG